MIAVKFTLSEAKDLPWSEVKEIANDDYDYWFGRGKEFLKGAATYLKDFENALSAFMLHQATESFYSSILLVFSNYKPKLHDLKKLGSRAENYNSELLKVFPIATSEQKECFKLFQKAYVDARYNKDYKMTNEPLLYLMDRVERLKQITEKMCLEKINDI